MGYTQKITWETLRHIDSADLSGSYLALGTPLANPSVILKMVNNSNVLVTISINGTSDIDVCPAGTFWLYDEAAISSQQYDGIPAGTQIFVKGSAGTGLIYLVTQYIERI